MSYRTDENNNPTAMTTDVASEGGLVLGVDYAQGTSFLAGIHLLHTAKFLGNPIPTTIRVLDKVGFYTVHGLMRWNYIGIPLNIWSDLTQAQKVSVIGFMYQHEGGTAMTSLFNSNTGENTMTQVEVIPAVLELQKRVTALEGEKLPTNTPAVSATTAAKTTVTTVVPSTALAASPTAFQKFVAVLEALEPVVLAGVAPFIKNPATGAIVASESPIVETLLAALAEL